jgi:hypothetical protein
LIETEYRIKGMLRNFVYTCICLLLEFKRNMLQICCEYFTILTRYLPDNTNRRRVKNKEHKQKCHQIRMKQQDNHLRNTEGRRLGTVSSISTTGEFKSVNGALTLHSHSDWVQQIIKRRMYIFKNNVYDTELSEVKRNF